MVCSCQSVHAAEVSETVITLSRKCVSVQWELYYVLCPFPGQLLVLASEKSIFQHKTIKGHGIITCLSSNVDASPETTPKKYARVHVLVNPVGLE